MILRVFRILDCINEKFQNSPTYGYDDISQSTSYLLTGGAEKKLRIFDLNRPDAVPTEIDALGTVRAAVWHHSDQTILTSSNDSGGIR